MATQHSLITGADNHEPKGVESAVAGRTYHANGAGSGVWRLTAAGEVTVQDANNVLTATNVEDALYELYQTSGLIEGVFTDVGSTETILLPVPYGCQVVSIKMILAGTLTAANSVVTVTRSDGAAMGSQVVAFSGSTEGTTFVFTPSGNNVFTNGVHNYIKLVSDGGASGVSKMYVQALVKRT